MKKSPFLMQIQPIFYNMPNQTRYLAKNIEYGVADNAIVNYQPNNGVSGQINGSQHQNLLVG